MFRRERDTIIDDDEEMYLCPRCGEKRDYCRCFEKEEAVGDGTE